MNPSQDEAVVVRLTEYSETSQIVTLFSARHGLLRLIAKGARRGTKQRPSAGLDLLELGEVGFLPPHGDAQLGTLTDWVQRRTFGGVRRELLRLYGALYAIELVASLTEEADPHPELFQALVRTLRVLASNSPAGPALPAFQSDLLWAIGYAPHLAECVDCHRPPPRGSPVYFSAGAGGLLCRDCEVHHAEKWRVPPRLLETTPPTGDPRAWFELLDYHLTHIAGRRFKTAAQVAALLAKGDSAA
jgi:DNA repair protein RecO (recombination protein O)